MMNIINEAFTKLYPEKTLNYESKLKYSGKFRAYNANIKLYKTQLTINMSKNWKTVDREIKIGLIQELMIKLFKDKKTSTNIDLYHIFLKTVADYIPKTRSDPILEQSFNRVNQTYFNSLLEIPNLEWGSHSRTKLGSYEYGSDTITISKIFLKTEQELLDYIMYHELLHKKHKFIHKNNRSHHHTKTFRHDESSFNNQEEIEQKIKKLLSFRKRRSFFDFFG